MEIFVEYDEGIFLYESEEKADSDMNIGTIEGELTEDDIKYESRETIVVGDVCYVMGKDDGFRIKVTYVPDELRVALLIRSNDGYGGEEDIYLYEIEGGRLFYDMAHSIETKPTVLFGAPAPHGTQPHAKCEDKVSVGDVVMVNTYYDKQPYIITKLG